MIVRSKKENLKLNEKIIEKAQFLGMKIDMRKVLVIWYF